MTEPDFADKTLWTGDNLDILRGMNSECVDLIYLDPPFNSNQDYAAPIGSAAAGAVFKDTWTLSDLDVAWMGLIADEQPAIANLLHTAKLTHGTRLLYVRLRPRSGITMGEPFPRWKRLTGAVLFVGRTEKI